MPCPSSCTVTDTASTSHRPARPRREGRGLRPGRGEPLRPDVPAAYLALHPFGRVPTLVHDGFALYETGAISRYIDRAFPGPALQPSSARGAGPHGPDHRRRRFLWLLADGAAGLLARASSGPGPASRRTMPKRSLGSRGGARRSWRRSRRSRRRRPFLRRRASSRSPICISVRWSPTSSPAPEGARRCSSSSRARRLVARVSATRPSMAATEPGLPITQSERTVL